MNQQENYGFPFKRIVLASYRLPFKVIKGKRGKRIQQNSGGLVSAMLPLAKKISAEKNGNIPLIWFGQSTKEEDEFENIKDDSNPFELHSVYIPPSTDKLYYGGFCNNAIWPLFHYFPFISVFDKDSFSAFREANTLFAEAIIKKLLPGDCLWIHDYQLFLLPELIRKSIKDITIGFFLHIPFPSTEIFRVMPKPWRESILKGMLGADLIGFHTFDYTYHFMRCVSRILGIETVENWLYLDERTVRADTFPISIDYAKFHNTALSKHIDQKIFDLSKSINNKKIIFSVDRLDYTKGFLQRISAFGHFLKVFPEFRQQVVFHMIMVPSRDTIDRYQQMKKDIEAAVARVNGEYGCMEWTPILYQYRSVPFDDLVAFYKQSDVALITPMRDGMNLVCKEYIACQTEDKPGVLILSELTGAASELSEALLINPMDQEEIAFTIHEALNMQTSEKLSRIKKMQSRISRYDILAWGKDFLNGLVSTSSEQERRAIHELRNADEYPFLRDYKNAKNRLIFLDYDGTLVPIEKFPELAVPHGNIKETLRSLSADYRNTVVIVSGRSREFIDLWLGDLPINLIAEHGACAKLSGKEWVTETPLDNEWKHEILSIMDRYVERCTGSLIEDKPSSLTWHYRNVQKEFGLGRSHELKDELHAWVRRNPSFQVLEGNKVIEVKRVGYDKGSAALKYLDNKSHDFIIAVGDDKTDEDLFRAMPAEAVTIKVGLTASIARYNLRNQRLVIKLLEKLLMNAD